jgi:hypothetical protein
MKTLRGCWALAPVLLAACPGASSTTVAGAAMTTALAGTVAGVRRAEGDCYTACNPGTVCNRKTGTCDALPCRGACMQWERCDESGVFPRCVRSTAPDMTLERKEKEPPPEPAGASDLPSR